jgi:4-alpha-glucanotransferase
MTRFICIHGHFYQPPRENPWLNEVELQPSAHPFHDWNERVTAECYLPNSSSQILDPESRIVDIVSNYEHISFNFGPTLLSWLSAERPQLYSAILEADRASQRHFSGHGSALAQVYSHGIMPLANDRDKSTEVKWAVADFEHRFGRKPEGMWLAETAVDIETLEALAAESILFTILAPHQAHSVRPMGEPGWQTLEPGSVDTTMAYRCPLPSGRTIDLFFYNGAISHEIAFGDLLRDGEGFAQSLLDTFPKQSPGPALTHIAVDGETFGHHHRFGDMALSYCLRHIRAGKEPRITVYGEFLELNPPTHEVQIAEHTSWSCAHGTARWAEDCGCSTGAHPEYDQRWRTPLRWATTWLSDQLAGIFEAGGKRLFKDPWAARDHYIYVVLDRSRENILAFLKRNGTGSMPSDEDRVQALKLCEMQRHALLMQASCGWFFDDISGLEPVQNMRSAARAMQLARETGGPDLEPEYTRILKQARSNDSACGNGKRVYEQRVQPAVKDVADFQQPSPGLLGKRRSGVLMHLTCLPSPYGTGDLGPEAQRFADWLGRASQTYWQILPLNPTDEATGHAPYSSSSAFAGNPLLVSPDLLASDGLLDPEQLHPRPDFPNTTVDFKAVTAWKTPLLDSAAGRITAGARRENFRRFCEENRSWLDDFALYRALKTQLGQAAWTQWPAELRDRNPDALGQSKTQLKHKILHVKALQFLFFDQYSRFRAHCNAAGLKLFGDLPIYVTLDSADVWANPNLFQLDENRQPIFVSGVPPDYFSETGQLWGNPVYQWEHHTETGFAWWMRRMEHTLKLFDLVRVDHFRGLVGYWKVPAHDETAVNGTWEPGPGDRFFTALMDRFDPLPVVAEDLGTITDDVRETMQRFGFPGMRVLLFAFGPDFETNPYAPHNHIPDCVVYTGTHDNNTTRGWFENEIDEDTRSRVERCVGNPLTPDTVSRALTELAMNSKAKTVIVPMQDLLGLGQEARMNHPALRSGNWLWRAASGQISDPLADKLAQITTSTGRNR